MEIRAAAGRAEKGDALVTVSWNGMRENETVISSPVRQLFSVQQDSVVSKTLTGLNASGLLVEIEDCQALDFVLAARVRAAVLRFRRAAAE